MKNCIAIYPRWVDNRQRKRKFKNLTGERFGRLVVLYRSTDEVMSNGNKTPRYACKCDCGAYVLTRATSLKSKHTSSCQSCNRKSSLVGKNLENLTGLAFHRWTVLERADSALEPSGKYATVWKCRCECGTIRNVRASSLKGNLTRSCGCYKHEQLTVKRELTGEAFGLWVVIERAKDLWISPTNGRWSYDWICKCECGTIRRVSEQSLITNKSTSCGCITESSLEVHTRTYLQELDIFFTKHKTFDDLRGVGDGLLSYDFAIYNDNLDKIGLIECQGKQHYEPCDFFGGEAQFKIQQVHDKRKKKYAERLNIPLLEIDYRMIKYDDVASKIDCFMSMISSSSAANTITCRRIISRCTITEK